MPDPVLSSIQTLLQREAELVSRRLSDAERQEAAEASSKGLFQSGIHLDRVQKLYEASLEERYNLLKAVITRVLEPVGWDKRRLIAEDMKTLARNWLTSQIGQLETGLSAKSASVRRNASTSVNAIDAEIDVLLAMPSSRTQPMNGEYFVEPERLVELRTLETDAFDLRRLIRLLEELDSSFQNGNFMAVTMLVRAILDHIPPIFGKKAFTEVANNVGSKSFKKAMQYLDDFARRVGDAYLHTQIRKTESLPNKTQVDCRAQIDLLLSEIIRVLPTE